MYQLDDAADAVVVSGKDRAGAPFEVAVGDGVNHVVHKPLVDGDHVVEHPVRRTALVGDDHRVGFLDEPGDFEVGEDRRRAGVDDARTAAVRRPDAGLDPRFHLVDQFLDGLAPRLGTVEEKGVGHQEHVVAGDGRQFRLAHHVELMVERLGVADFPDGRLEIFSGELLLQRPRKLLGKTANAAAPVLPALLALLDPGKLHLEDGVSHLLDDARRLGFLVAGRRGHHQVGGVVEVSRREGPHRRLDQGAGLRREVLAADLVVGVEPVAEPYRRGAEGVDDLVGDLNAHGTHLRFAFMHRGHVAVIAAVEFVEILHRLGRMDGIFFQALEHFERFHRLMASLALFRGLYGVFVTGVHVSLRVDRPASVLQSLPWWTGIS